MVPDDFHDLSMFTDPALAFRVERQPKFFRKRQPVFFKHLCVCFVSSSDMRIVSGSMHSASQALTVFSMTVWT